MMDAISQKEVVFCDFDGTINVEETFVGMLKQFATLPSYEKRVGFLKSGGDDGFSDAGIDSGPKRG